MRSVILSRRGVAASDTLMFWSANASSGAVDGPAVGLPGLVGAEIDPTLTVDPFGLAIACDDVDELMESVFGRRLVPLESDFWMEQ